MATVMGSAYRSKTRKILFEMPVLHDSSVASEHPNPASLETQNDVCQQRDGPKDGGAKGARPVSGSSEQTPNQSVDLFPIRQTCMTSFERSIETREEHIWHIWYRSWIMVFGALRVHVHVHLNHPEHLDLCLSDLEHGHSP